MYCTYETDSFRMILFSLEGLGWLGWAEQGASKVALGNYPRIGDDLAELYFHEKATKDKYYFA